MKRFFALLLSCLILCLSVGAVYEVNDDTSIGNACSGLSSGRFCG